ncbi:hypothetical protein [Maricaulis salignorans]|uniref:hypothetical protein n=1 Tax=Maricaulis salignorans TaxID=144026 RepID=UPI003A92BCD0
MLVITSLLAATLLQGAAPHAPLQGLPTFPNGHYVERLADGSSACGEATARWFDLDVRTPPNNPSGIDGHAGSLVVALGAAPVDYQLTYALSFAEPDPAFDMRTMHMIDGRVTLDDGTGPYTLRTSFLTSANGDAELTNATASDGGPPIHLVITAHEPRTHGALANGAALQPFERCPAEAG